MGASVWNRRVPYQADITAALRQAREEAYADGDYYLREPDPQARQMSEEEYVALAVAEDRAALVREFGEDGAWEPGDEFARQAWHAAQIDVTGRKRFSGIVTVVSPGYGVGIRNVGGETPWMAGGSISSATSVPSWSDTAR